MSGSLRSRSRLGADRGAVVDPFFLDVDVYKRQELTDSMIADSGRLTAFFRILDDIAARREKVVVFVQHFDVQYVVALAIRARYGLDHMPGKINGTMPPAARQRVVTEFQDGRPGFDAVVLTGRAAGTGLTLTAMASWEP